MRATTITSRGQTYDAYYFDSRYFELDGERHEIVGTIINGGGIMDAEHRVKVGKEIKIMQHEMLVKKFKAGKLQTLKN